MRNLLRVFSGPMVWYRLANWLYRKHIPLLPRLIDYSSRILFACWVPHTAQIGRNTVLGYGGLSIVIHDRALIGDNVHIGVGVVIGGNARQPGQPKIGDDVYIGSGAKILGPIIVGRESIVGANSVVLTNVPNNCVVAGVPARVVHEGIHINQYLWHLKQRST